MVELLDNGDLIANAESLIEIPETPALAALREAQAEGRGILLISGHYGQFDAGRIGLRTRGIERLTMVGLATDFCVHYSAVDAAKLGFKVTVQEAACRGIDMDGSLEAARTSMRAAGVVLED